MNTLQNPYSLIKSMQINLIDTKIEYALGAGTKACELMLQIRHRICRPLFLNLESVATLSGFFKYAISATANPQETRLACLHYF